VLTSTRPICSLQHLRVRVCSPRRQHGIVLAGYSGLMSLTHRTGGPVDAVVARIAGERGLSQAQVLLMWGLQQGVMVVTTSGKRERLDEYVAAAAAAAGGAPLSDADVAAIRCAAPSMEGGRGGRCGRGTRANTHTL
jgi:diketogulonate reductase-like aldo/keto reductase